MLYNDDENNNTKDIYIRVWNTISRIQYFRQNPEMRISIELTDRGGSHVIVAHEPVIIYNYYKFDDYWNIVKDKSANLDNYFNNANDGTSYSRIYVYFY